MVISLINYFFKISKIRKKEVHVNSCHSLPFGIHYWRSLDSLKLGYLRQKSPASKKQGKEWRGQWWKGRLSLYTGPVGGKSKICEGSASLFIWEEGKLYSAKLCLQKDICCFINYNNCLKTSQVFHTPHLLFLYRGSDLIFYWENLDSWECELLEGRD